MTNTELDSVVTCDLQKMLPLLLCVVMVLAKSQGPGGRTCLWFQNNENLPSMVWPGWEVGTADREPFSLKGKARVALSRRSQPGNAAFEFSIMGWRGSVHWYAAYCTIFLLLLQMHQFLHLIICFKEQKSESVEFALPMKEKPRDLPRAYYRVVKTYVKPRGFWCQGLVTKGDTYYTIHWKIEALLLKSAELGANWVQHMSVFEGLISADVQRGDYMFLHRNSYSDLDVTTCEYFV